MSKAASSADALELFASGGASAPGAHSPLRSAH